ncbi:MAG: hypothetical protein F6J87_16755 [Spirulina sp. SIO3F2]|nr:hypothetical protein [Spirulina sp. SIO3F2]
MILETNSTKVESIQQQKIHLKESNLSAMGLENSIFSGTPCPSIHKLKIVCIVGSIKGYDQG